MPFDSESAVKINLGRLLSIAIRNGSPFEIAVVLGSAAELQYFPDDRTLDLCASAVRSEGNKASRAVLWAVRHRCARALPHCQRLVVPDV